MKDRTDEAYRLYHSLIMAKSGSESLQQGCEMFDTARIMVRASLKADSEADLRVSLFFRLYGGDFPSEERDRITSQIREHLKCESLPKVGIGDSQRKES